MLRNTKKKTKISQRLRARALAIIKGNYDNDTQESIRYMLRTNDEDLADMVRDAEKGVTICDTGMAQAKQREGIRQVVKILNVGQGILPLWFLEAVNGALVAVATDKGVDASFVNLSEHGLWQGMNPNAGKLITALFQEAPTLLDRKLAFAPVRTEQERVSDAMNELLSNPRTPGDLYEKLAEFIIDTVDDRGTVNERGHKDSMIFSKAMMPLIIAAHPEDELQGAIEIAQADRRRAEKEAQL
jgi:hypothetical protein